MPIRDMPNRLRLRPALAKVPEITLIFWVLKLLTTGMGEAMSDFLAQQNVALAALIGIGGIVLALRLQFRQPAYSAPHYWFAVMMVAVFGTMAADGIRIGAGVRYSVTTPLFALATAAIFLRLVPERGHPVDPLDQHPAPRALLLGGRAGHVRPGHGGRRPDRLPAQSGLLGLGRPVRRGDLDPGHHVVARGMNPIVAFWFAYVVTRPLGASFADGFSKPTQGGLNLGDGTVSAIALVVFVALVAHVARSRRDVQDPAEQVRSFAHQEREARQLGLSPATDMES